MDTQQYAFCCGWKTCFPLGRLVCYQVSGFLIGFVRTMHPLLKWVLKSADTSFSFPSYCRLPFVLSTFALGI